MYSVYLLQKCCLTETAIQYVDKFTFSLIYILCIRWDRILCIATTYVQFLPYFVQTYFFLLVGHSINIDTYRLGKNVYKKDLLQNASPANKPKNVKAEIFSQIDTILKIG